MHRNSNIKKTVYTIYFRDLDNLSLTYELYAFPLGCQWKQCALETLWSIF